MPKLHELLAVERSLKTQAEKCRSDLKDTFQKKAHHFSEKVKTFQSSEENAPSVTEEQLDLQTTVPGELKWLSEFVIKSLDTSFHVAEANMDARADVVLEGDSIPFLTGIPATSLLELQKRVKELHDFVTAIPTLDPAKGFRPDPDRGADIYRARPTVSTRTKKMNKPVVLYAHTDKHPAQVQLLVEDVPTGTITTLEWSGLITPATKGEMLERVENLDRAVKKARARANETEVLRNERRIGSTIVNYVFGL